MPRRKQPIRRERIGKPLRQHDPAKTSLDTRFEDFLDVKARVHSESGRENAEYAYQLYRRWLVESKQPVVVASFSVENIERYARYLKVRPAYPGRRPFDGQTLSTHSQHTYLRPLDTFGDWLGWEGWVETNPFCLAYESLLPKLDQSVRIIKKAVPADIRALLDATAGDDPLALRDRAVLLVGWETGMRTQDLCGLELPNLDLHTGRLAIYHSKGDKDREVVLGTDALQAVAAYLGTGRPRQAAAAQWLMARAGRGTFSSTALFLSDHAGRKKSSAGRLTANGIYQLLTRRWNAAGRKGKFGGHRLRHGLATLLVESGVSMGQVAAWLGQSLETVTMLYAHPSASAIHRSVGPIVAKSLRQDDHVGLGAP
jgi:site-specific recombinase XerD